MHIKKVLLLSFLLFAFKSNAGLVRDTITVYSEAFKTERSFTLIQPDEIKYFPKNRALPRIYLLDGQHHWFIEPIISQIEYLWYTHQIPYARIIVIPHADRNKESIMYSLNDELPLSKFIENEIEPSLVNFPDNGMRMLIGHSFTASYALHAGLQNRSFYSHVIAHSPLNLIQDLTNKIADFQGTTKFYISVGGKNPSKDMHHRIALDAALSKLPATLKHLNIYTEESAAHNSVPILTNAKILSEIFFDYSIRFHLVPEVDKEYKLVYPPGTADEEMEKIKKQEFVLGYPYPAELPEINGIASKYYNNEFYEHALAVFLYGHSLYPEYFEFPAYAGELIQATSADQACQLFSKALELLDKHERSAEDYSVLRQELTNALSACP